MLTAGRLVRHAPRSRATPRSGLTPSRRPTPCSGLTPPGRHAPRNRPRVRPAALVAAALLFAACSDDEPAGPTPPPSAVRYSSIDAGYYHTCALTPSGSAHCWGRNSFGTLGDGITDDRTLPTPVDGGPTLVSLDAGAGHNCALTAAGAAWCWGDDSQGQLGDGDPTDAGKSPDPVHVQVSEPFASVVAGYYQTCGLTTTGTAYCWGLNGAGQNGDGSTTTRHTPAAVSGGLSFTSIAPGDRFACGLGSGDTWCWGINPHGQLGPLAPDTSLVPFRLDDARSGPADVFASAGASTIPGTESYGCALFTDGRTDYCGGANFGGQLGDGTRTAQSRLVAVLGPAS